MNSTASRWVAFLRGINLGKRQIKMDELRGAFEECGYTKPITVLASGNVIFDAPQSTPGDGGEHPGAALEACLSAAFGFHIDVILRTIPQLHTLADANPFGAVTATPETRRYVSFLPAEPAWDRPLPYEYPGGLQVLRVAGGDVCSVLILSPANKTTDAMSVLEKEFGKKITTRNWNTVIKILHTSP